MSRNNKDDARSVQYLSHGVGAKPRAHGFLVYGLPHKADLVDAVGGGLVVQEALHHAEVLRLVQLVLLRARPQPPAAAEPDVEQRAGQHHLAAPQHAAPPLVTRHARAADRREVSGTIIKH